jgi:hypothetical protein
MSCTRRNAAWNDARTKRTEPSGLVSGDVRHIEREQPLCCVERIRRERPVAREADRLLRHLELGRLGEDRRGAGREEGCGRGTQVLSAYGAFGGIGLGRASSKKEPRIKSILAAQPMRDMAAMDMFVVAGRMAHARARMRARAHTG